MAKSAMVDNTMMKTVAIVSLVYLPGTFVSVSDFYHEQRGRGKLLTMIGHFRDELL